MRLSKIIGAPAQTNLNFVGHNIVDVKNIPYPTANPHSIYLGCLGPDDPSNARVSIDHNPQQQSVRDECKQTLEGDAIDCMGEYVHYRIHPRYPCLFSLEYLVQFSMPAHFV